MRSSGAETRARVLLVAGVVSGVSLAAAGLVEGGGAGKTLPDGVVAIVNGEAVTAEAFAQFEAAVTAERRGAPLDDSQRQRLLDRLVDEELLLQRGLALGLARHEPTARRSIVSALVATVTSDVESGGPDEDTLRRFHSEMTDRFRRPERIVAEVVFASAVSRPEADAFQRAAEAARRLRAGEPAEAVAAELGDPQTAPLPGGEIPLETLRQHLGPSAAAATDALAPGEVSDPVRGGSGYTVVRLAGRSGGEPASFEEVAPQVRSEWLRAESERALGDYLERAPLRWRSDGAASVARGRPRRGAIAVSRIVRGGFALGFSGLLAAWLVPAAAFAHGRSTSISAFEIEPGPPTRARISVRAPVPDLQRAVPGLASLGASATGIGDEALLLMDRYLQEHVALHSAGKPCAAVGPAWSVVTADPSHLGRAWQVLCESAGPLAVESTAFFDVQPTHLHLARIRLSGAPAVEQVLVASRPRAALAAEDAGPAVGGSGLLDYLALGVEHIFSGTDHVCFVLALLLVGATLGEVATVVTGFTAAHSVTLALGVLGVVRPETAAVEALIGLSIVVVALENFFETAAEGTRRLVRGGLSLLIAAAVGGSAAGVVAVPLLALAGVGLFSLCYLGLLARARRPARLRWLVAFVFGLVHGFGFAGVLAETGLPPGRTAQALVGFNAGVEIGQLAIVVALWPLYRALLSRRPALRPVVVQVGSAAVLAAGLFWFLTRALEGA